MGSLSLQDTGLECTLHGIDLFTLCLTDLMWPPSRTGYLCYRHSGARIIGGVGVVGNINEFHFGRAASADEFKSSTACVAVKKGADDCGRIVCSAEIERMACKRALTYLCLRGSSVMGRQY